MTYIKGMTRSQIKGMLAKARKQIKEAEQEFDMTLDIIKLDSNLTRAINTLEDVISPEEAEVEKVDESHEEWLRKNGLK